MNARGKITKSRELYIKESGDEPTALIIGYAVFNEIVDDTVIVEHGGETVARFYQGMQVIVDNNKPFRVELGDLDVDR